MPAGTAAVPSPLSARSVSARTRSVVAGPMRGEPASARVTVDGDNPDIRTTIGYGRVRADVDARLVAGRRAPPVTAPDRARIDGEAGIRLLGEAVVAYRAALTVRTKEHLPQDWATIQNHLGVALQEQGSRTGGEAGCGGR